MNKTLFVFGCDGVLKKCCNGNKILDKPLPKITLLKMFKKNGNKCIIATASVWSIYRKIWQTLHIGTCKVYARKNEHESDFSIKANAIIEELEKDNYQKIVIFEDNKDKLDLLKTFFCSMKYSVLAIYVPSNQR